nr:class I SAM-dependent methyltransferase [Micromonospora sp. DSM 115978]
SVVEIGSGKGDFLRDLCRRAGCRGTGYDSTYVGPQKASDADVEFVADYYGPRFGHLPADLVVCRHVLEHVVDPLGFLKNVRAALGERSAALYLEVPSGAWTVSEPGAWDWIYQHVSYFSPAGLQRLVTAAGFDVVACDTSFGGQFLWLEAVARDSSTASAGVLEDISATQRYVTTARDFSGVYSQVVDRWRNEFAAADPGALSGSGGVHNSGVSVVDRSGAD